MALVVVIFTCSWVPLGYIVLTARHQTFAYSTIIWTATVGLANSAINPLLHFFRSQEYRCASKGLLSRYFGCFVVARRSPKVNCTRTDTTAKTLRVDGAAREFALTGNHEEALRWGGGGGERSCRPYTELPCNLPPGDPQRRKSDRR